MKEYTKIRQIYAWIGFIVIILAIPTAGYLITTLIK